MLSASDYPATTRRSIGWAAARATAEAAQESQSRWGPPVSRSRVPRSGREDGGEAPAGAVRREVAAAGTLGSQPGDDREGEPEQQHVADAPHDRGREKPARPDAQPVPRQPRRRAPGSRRHRAERVAGHQPRRRPRGQQRLGEHDGHRRDRHQQPELGRRQPALDHRERQPDPDLQVEGREAGAGREHHEQARVAPRTRGHPLPGGTAG